MVGGKNVNHQHSTSVAGAVSNEFFFWCCATRVANYTDLVSLIVTDEDFCGAAYFPNEGHKSFYSVVSTNCIALGVEYTLPHELGHNAVCFTFVSG